MAASSRTPARRQAVSTTARPKPQALVLTQQPERQHLDALQAGIEACRDRIAELDVDTETLRQDLQNFEQQYLRALSFEHAVLGRIDGLLRHASRWLTLLQQSNSSRGRRAHASSLFERRSEEIYAWHAARSQERAQTQDAAEVAPQLDEAVPRSQLPSSSRERLKVAFRALARRYHPDLAEGEQDRQKRSRLMAHVNALYHAGDWQRLEALLTSVQGAQGDDVLAQAEALQTLSLPERIAAAQKRLLWFEAVCRGLQDEQDALFAGPTYALWEMLASSPDNGAADPFAVLRDEAQASIAARFNDVPRALRALEEAVRQHKRQQGRKGQGVAVHAPDTAALSAASFDPHVGHALSQLGLDTLRARQSSAPVQKCAANLAAMAEQEPALVRLVLFAYIVQLSGQPLPGLDSYAELERRFAAASAHDAQPMSLAEALVYGDTLVEFGVHGLGQEHAHARLLLRERHLAQAVPALLQNFAVRQLFAGVLLHLGEQHSCAACHKRSYHVPLFWVRGVDDVRAWVCAACGVPRKRYVMARGDDIQAVLNRAYLDFDIIEECSLQLGRTTIGLQMLATQAAATTVRALRMRLQQDVLQRHGIDLPLADLRLHLGERRIEDAATLGGLNVRRLHVRLRPGARYNEQGLLDELRFRVRTRFASLGPLNI